MKKIIILAVALLLTLSGLAACGGSSGPEESAAPEAPAAEDSQATDESGSGDAPASSAPGTILDLNDKNIYFAIIDGKEFFILERHTVQDLINAGYKADPETDLGRMVNYGIYVGDELFDIYIKMYKEGGDKVYFRAYPQNPNSDPIPLKDCLIYGFSCSNSEADFSVVGNLKLGDPEQAFRDVFYGVEPDNEGDVPGYKDRRITNYMASDAYGVFSFAYSEDADAIKEISVSYLPH